MTVTNFGKNVSFEPRDLLAPTSEGEILACLDESRSEGRRVRAIGSLHSWSDVVAGDDLVLNLRNLNRIELSFDGDNNAYAEIGAGCTIDRALDYLFQHGGYTLPTYGMFGGQTVAGAMSTATHGSGRSSLSHYVTKVRVAAYDKDGGKARIYEWDHGDELLAARCGLGCTGILLSVRFRVERDYLIQEQTQWYDRIEEVLEQEREYPRQQFYLVPWSWRWFAQHRRPLDPESGARKRRNAFFERIVIRLVGVDIVLNGIVRLLAGTLKWWTALRWFYRCVFPRFARSGKRVVDRAPHILMIRHDFYRHVEMELFVPESRVAPAAEFLESVLRTCGGESLAAPATGASGYPQSDVMGDLEALKGTYVHDHLITVRRVLRDQALISMSSDIEAWYAMSLVTYQRDLSPFLQMARFVARRMAAAFGARPHWGKICPLEARDIAALYPDCLVFAPVARRSIPITPLSTISPGGCSGSRCSPLGPKTFNKRCSLRLEDAGARDRSYH